MWLLGIKFKIIFQKIRYNVEISLSSIADKKKTVLCHFLSAPRLMKKVAERIFIAPPIWILCRCNHSLFYKSCIAVHQVDDVGMVLGVLVL